MTENRRLVMCLYLVEERYHGAVRSRNVLHCPQLKHSMLLCLVLRKSLLGSGTELGSPPDTPTLIFEDNQSAIAMTNNPTFHGRSKHIDICELVSQGIEYSLMTEMTADILTKDLS